MAAVEMKVEQVTLDPVLGAPVVILREKLGDRLMPIWVGQIEAAAIVSELRNVPMARPSSHDLMKEMIFRLRATVTQVIVTALKNGTYFAEVELKTQNGTVRLDSRPSDAIALALRARSPIRVERAVFEQATRLTDSLEGIVDSDRGPRVLFESPLFDSRAVLEGMPEEDFGKWKM